MPPSRRLTSPLSVLPHRLRVADKAWALQEGEQLTAIKMLLGNLTDRLLAWVCVAGGLHDNTEGPYSLQAVEAFWQEALDSGGMEMPTFASTAHFCVSFTAAH